MARSEELERRIDEFVRELAEEFGELPESDEPLITQIEDRAIKIGDAVMAKMMERGLRSGASTDRRECCPSCGRPEQQRSPTDEVPSLACVEMDGGQIQMRSQGQANSGRRTSVFDQPTVADAVRRVSPRGPADQVEPYRVDDQADQSSREGQREVLVRRRRRGAAATVGRLPIRDRSANLLLEETPVQRHYSTAA